MKTKFEASLGAILLLLLLHHSRPALAQWQPGGTVAAPAHPRRNVSVTISPFHLTLPVVELTTEVRVMDKLGLAAVVGAGQMTSKATSSTPKLTADVWEVGVQGRYYVLGDFRHGMQIGTEAIYLHASGDVEGISAAADGFAVGGFLGYKVMADVGFTFDTQLGYEVVGIGAKATDGTSTASASRQDGIVLLNLNIGWSF